jgi:hypothetical protein
MIKFEISKEWWRTYFIIAVFSFILLAMITNQIIQQRDSYADEYFNYPKTWTCSIELDANKQVMVSDYNMQVNKISVSLPCNEAMTNKLFQGMEVKQ